MSTQTGRGAGEGTGAARVEESPAGRSLGLIVPRVEMLVCAIDGPLAGLIVPRARWNARVNLARLTQERFGTPQRVLAYTPAMEALIAVRYDPDGAL